MFGGHLAFVSEDSVDIDDASGQNGEKETKSENDGVSNTSVQRRFSTKEGVLELIPGEGRGIFGTETHCFRFSWDNYKSSNGWKRLQERVAPGK